MAHTRSDSPSALSSPLLAKRVAFLRQHSSHNTLAYQNQAEKSVSTREYASDSSLEDEVDLETLVSSPAEEVEAFELPPYREKSQHLPFGWGLVKSDTARRFLRSSRAHAIAAILLFLLIFSIFAVLRISHEEHDNFGVIKVADPIGTFKTAPSDYVLGPPTTRFRDNLRKDLQYVTSWNLEGLTNQFMAYTNLLYMAILSGRVAIVPPFGPAHLPMSAGFVHFGDVFDIPRLSRAMQTPVIEWRDVKDVNSTQVDELGCWSVWAVPKAGGNARRPQNGPIEEQALALDVSYSPVPAEAAMEPENLGDPHIRFGIAAALTFPDGRSRAGLPGEAPFPGRLSGHTALPDEHIACFDFLYFVSDSRSFEYFLDYSPAWRFVGKHAHWTPRIEGVALDMIRDTLGVARGAPIPPFISIHARHSDFGMYCQTLEDGSRDPNCFAPLSAFANRVDEVRAELREKRGIEVKHVLVTSDERDIDWWQAVRGMGWDWVDHIEQQTEERFGPWYPILIDVIIQSLGAGFVGTDQSTMSLLAARRVQDWNGGVTRQVRWGHEGADNPHKRDGDCDGDDRGLPSCQALRKRSLDHDSFPVQELPSSEISGKRGMDCTSDDMFTPECQEQAAGQKRDV